MKVMYISGPFGTKADDRDDYHLIDRNIILASEYALAVSRKGWAPFCPHKNTAGFQHVKDLSPEFWMDVCLEFVTRSDAILMIPGWEKSPGAVREKHIADISGVMVFYAKDGIPEA